MQVRNAQGQYTNKVRVHCDQCQMLSINGVACHEIGCMNVGARWDRQGEVWVKQRTCRECGGKVDVDNECCNPFEVNE